MSDSDVTFKLILPSAKEMLRQLGVESVTTWLNVELPRVRNRRADLVGRTASGVIYHIEVQNQNHPGMPLRMAEYALFILETHGEYPHQLVLYVGDPKLTMKPRLETHGMSFHYDQLDIRQLDGARLLESPWVSDNIAALMTKLDDSAGSIRKVVRKIGKLKKQSDREKATALLFSAAELRHLEDTVSEEVCKVPIILKTSINNKTFGPWIRKGVAKGMEKGMEKGMLKGMHKGMHKGVVQTLRLQLEKRFGALPPEIARRLTKSSESEAEQLALAVMDAKSLDELFPTASRRR